MAKPTQPKEIKPKADVPADKASGGVDITKLIVINAVTALAMCLIFTGASYVLNNSLISSKIDHLASSLHSNPEGDEDGEEEELDGPGIILDLNEFILNLNDPRSKRYLKINVALELSRLHTDPAPISAAHPPAGGGGGHGGGHGASAPDPMELIDAEMSQYKPAIRDSIISILSSKTAEELQSIAGKELAKEQIKEAVDGIFDGKREVKRVSFGNFIIQ